MATNESDPVVAKLVEVLRGAGFPQTPDVRQDIEGFHVIPPPEDAPLLPYCVLYFVPSSQQGWKMREEEQLLRCRAVLHDAGFGVVERRGKVGGWIYLHRGRH